MTDLEKYLKKANTFKSVNISTESCPEKFLCFIFFIQSEIYFYAIIQNMLNYK